MHVTHIQGVFSPEHGGPCFSLANYCRGQIALGNRVSVRVLEGFAHTSPAIRLAPPVDMRVCPVDPPARFGASTALKRLLSHDPSPDVYHLHGVWLRAMHYGAVEARRRRRPYIVELMGSYELWARRQKGFSKWLARTWYQDGLLQRAACLHVNSQNEARDLRALGFRTPIAVIPVGVNIETSAPAELSPEHAAILTALGHRPFVLFLARIHPKKGIDILLRAWAKLNPQWSDWPLVIAGTGDPAYVAEYRKSIAELGIGPRCVWLGQVSEAQKAWLYSQAAVYVLPSHSENFGNTVAEALAHGTPVITTPHTAWTNLPAEGCGWLSATEVEPLRDVLSSALQMEPSERRRMGQRGRRLIEQHHSLTSVVEQVARVYTWTLGGPKPDDLLY